MARSHLGNFYSLVTPVGSPTKLTEAKSYVQVIYNTSATRVVRVWSVKVLMLSNPHANMANFQFRRVTTPAGGVTNTPAPIDTNNMPLTGVVILDDATSVTEQQLISVQRVWGVAAVNITGTTADYIYSADESDVSDYPGPLVLRQNEGCATIYLGGASDAQVNVITRININNN